MAEFAALTDQVTAACCTHAKECAGGLPTACDACCSAVLPSFSLTVYNENGSGRYCYSY